MIRTNLHRASHSSIRTGLGSVLLFGLLTACGAPSDAASFRMGASQALETGGWSTSGSYDSDDWTTTSGSHDFGGGSPPGSSSTGGFIGPFATLKLSPPSRKLTTMLDWLRKLV